MADYYAVLKRTLSGFGEPSESLRRKIYEKARVTIARQLDATQPPLADETKAAQLTQLDEAIERMEAEYAEPPADDFIGDPPPLPIGGGAIGGGPIGDGSIGGSAAIPETEAAQPEAEPVAVSESVETEPVPSEPLVSELPASEGEADRPDVPTFDAEPASASEPIQPIAAAEVPAAQAPAAEAVSVETVPAGSETSPEDDPLADAFAAIEAARAEAPPSPDASAAEAAPSGSEEDEPVAFDQDAFSAAAEAETAPAIGVPRVSDPVPDASARPNETAPPTAVTGDAFDDPAVAERDAAALGAAPVSVPGRAERKGGRGVLFFLLAIAAIGLLFVFRAPLLAAVGVPAFTVDRFLADLPVVGPYLVGELDDPNDPTRPKPVPTIRITPTPEPVAPADEGKREQRLGPDGVEVDPAAGREDVGTLPAPNIPAPAAEPDASFAEPDVPSDAATDVTTTTQTIPITPAEPASEADEATAPEVNLPEVAIAGPSTEPEAEAVAPAEAAAEQPAVVVAQTAVLYEEGGGTRETRSDRGAVVWSLAEESPGNGEPAEPAIRAELDVPERALKATITIRRNTDKALAASHLMEVNFQPGPDFSGQNVDEVLSVRMKPGERGQGAPLSVIPAKIAPGYFYIALDNLPSARERNVELLRTSKFVDIPIEYVTGRRALVSLEKGVTGERVFAQALAAWEGKPD